MYRQIIMPITKEHSVDLPESLYGKQVEITVREIATKHAKTTHSKKLPSNLKNKAFWDDITYNPSFPSVLEIRNTAWPKRNW